MGQFRVGIVKVEEGILECATIDVRFPLVENEKGKKGKGLHCTIGNEKREKNSEAKCKIIFFITILLLIFFTPRVSITRIIL
jgi:hypothetical protein